MAARRLVHYPRIRGQKSGCIMPEHMRDLALHTTQHAAFALPGSVARGVAYLSDPACLFGALPSMERVIERRGGTYRITLAPINLPGHALRPAAEVAFTTTATRVVIQSVRGEPHDLQPGEVATDVGGAFNLSARANGCAVQAMLRLAARIPARVIPPLMPRMIAQRTAEAMLVYRMKAEFHAMTQALIAGYAAWEMNAATE